MGKSKIEWTDRVWNPATGCSKISLGCKNCYAERMAKRLAGRCGYPADDPFRVTLHPDRIGQPLKWKKPSRIFVCSMADLFHEDVPFKFIMQVFLMMWDTPHTYLVLTKRPDRMLAFFEWLKDFDTPQIFPLDNVWLGVTAENQEQADRRIPLLLQTPAAKRFVSVEPILGPVDLKPYLPGGRSTYWQCICGTKSMPLTDDTKCRCADLYDQEWTLHTLDWVICGGESGPNARPCHPDWVRSLHYQCQVAGVPFMFKQWGEWAPNCLCDTLKPHRTVKRPEPGKQGCMFHCGKKSAGRLLDGKEHMEMPAHV